ncbi:MAG: 50S ribosomal protein L25/general stress protein Ctc [Cytophagales bacterium]|nr:50S ribosomal protein L25/general stress protein Ctc [Cytophagales bacterium]
MKTLEIIGYKRANLGKKEAKRLRKEGNVPCVLYGEKEQVHFYAPMALFKELVYTSEAHFVHLTIEGTAYKCILQDIQFHPVSEIILHADFLVLSDNKKVKMNIPIVFSGRAPGVEKGGEFIKIRRALQVLAYPQDMPGHIDLTISTLDFGKAIKVKDIKEERYEVLDPKVAPIAVVEIPRALRGKTTAAEGEEATSEATKANSE